MADHEEAGQHAERCCRHCKEVHRRNCFAMIPQEDPPTLPRIPMTPNLSQVPRDGPLRKPKFQQLPVDSGRSPGWILSRHTLDQFSNWMIHPRSAPVGPAGNEPPVQPKPCTMPAHYCFRPHQDQTRRRAIQKSRSNLPNVGRGFLPFSTSTCWRKARISSARSCRDRRNAPAHPNTLTTKRNINRFYSTVGRIRRVDSMSKLLILRLNSILATHRT